MLWAILIVGTVLYLVIRYREAREEVRAEDERRKAGK